MEEDLKVLEEFIEKNIKSRLRTELNANELQAIENLIARYKELEEEDLKIRAKFILSLEDYIPKSKVKEIIQDIDNNQPVIAELKLRKLVEGDK